MIFINLLALVTSLFSKTCRTIRSQISKVFWGSPIPGMGIFHFRLDQKIPGDLGFSRLKNPQNIPNPGDLCERKIPKSGNYHPGHWGFLESGDFNRRGMGIFMPGIFTKSRGYMRNPRDLHFYPGNRGFLRIFYPLENLGMGIFFVGWDIPPKSHV